MAEAEIAARSISAPVASVTRPVIVPWSCCAVTSVGQRRTTKTSGAERWNLDMPLTLLLPVAIAAELATASYSTAGARLPNKTSARTSVLTLDERGPQHLQGKTPCSL